MSSDLFPPPRVHIDLDSHNRPNRISILAHLGLESSVMPQAVPPNPTAQSNGTDPAPIPPTELAFALPTSPDTNVHLQITSLSHALTVYLASSTSGAPASMAALGSLVYALPSRNPTDQPLSTALYTRPSSVDFSTRLARILARKLGKPVYVGGEVKFWSLEDEGVAMRGAVEVVVQTVRGAG